MNAETLPQILDYARQHHAESLSVVPLLPNTRTEWMRRKSARKPATIELAVPDELVKELRGEKTKRPLVFLLVIPRGVADEAQSPIARPGIVLAP